MVIQVSSKNPISSEDVEKEYEMYSKSLNGRLLRIKLLKIII